MKRLFKRIVTLCMAMAMCLCVLPAEAAQSDATDIVKGIYIGTVDYGNGVIGYEYVSYVDALSAIQPCVVTQRTASKSSEIYLDGSYSFTITQTATFTYGSPDEIVRISSRRGTVSSYSSSSPYRAGTVSSSSVNGSPAVVTSTFGIYYASNWALHSNGSCKMCCKNTGVIY